MRENERKRVRVSERLIDGWMELFHREGERQREIANTSLFSMNVRYG